MITNLTLDRRDLGVGLVFLWTCLASCSAMRVLMKHCEWLATPGLALFSVVLGVGLAWRALRLWRERCPLKCAAGLGLCAALAGSGLYALVVFAKS